MIEDSYFCSSVPAEAVIIAILKYASFCGLCCLKNGKVKSFKQCFCWDNVCCVKSYKKFSKCSLSALTQAHSRFATCFALSIIRYWKSAEKFAVRMNIHLYSPFTMCRVAILLLWKPHSWF